MHERRENASTFATVRGSIRILGFIEDETTFLRVNPVGTALDFSDEKGMQRAAIAAFRSGPMLDVIDRDGRPIWQALR